MNTAFIKKTTVAAVATALMLTSGMFASTAQAAFGVEEPTNSIVQEQAGETIREARGGGSYNGRYHYQGCVVYWDMKFCFGS